MTVGGGANASSSPLGDRYTVERELGRGGFGQTYLAKDRHRYGELCVVKEFVPQVEDKATLAKAKELFEREASVLYQLEHKQIPEFRQLLEVESETGGRLFLVQDYVAGLTYQALLEERRRFGGQFTETEITQLLYQLLPVLCYIHNFGLVHRDISPDNLILRQTDGLPVLIDFGSVKEIAAAVRSQLSIEGLEPAPTRIGKVGYVPQEQLSTGNTDPTSDLYGLAATLLVLATGKDPQVLNDPYHGTWSGYESLSPKLGGILRRMLAANPEDRFPTAEAVLTALESEGTRDANDEAVSSDSLYAAIDEAGSTNVLPVAIPHDTDYEDTPVIPMAPSGMAAAGMGAAGIAGANMAPSFSEPATEGADMTYLEPAETAADESDVYEPLGPDRVIGKPDTSQAAIGLLVMLGLVGVLLLLALLRMTNRPNQPELAGDAPATTPDLVAGDYSPEEEARKREIDSRQEALGIDSGYFTRLVDQLFYQQYPTLLTSGPGGGRKSLSPAPADEPLRIRWDNIALGLLEKLDGNLSDRALSSLGSYSEADRAEWRSQIRSTNVDGRSLDDLTDARFFSLFPQQSGRDFLTRPVGQLYYAIADDRARAIESGDIRTDLQFAEGSFSQDVNGQLRPGNGRVYTMRLSAGQLLRLNLAAPDNSTLLSLYPPSSGDGGSSVFADSEQTTWSGGVDQSGYYQLVVVNRSAEAIDYQMVISVDSVTTTPVTPPLPAVEEGTDSDETTPSAEETDSAPENDDATTDEAADDVTDEQSN
ncbi:MAG: serine/threonine-protein kinase [Phormidesmis sp.]